jgi:hypothetical protein
LTQKRHCPGKNRIFRGASPEYQNTRIPYIPKPVFWVFLLKNAISCEELWFVSSISVSLGYSPGGVLGDKDPLGTEHAS